jgi:hypothetical protein
MFERTRCQQTSYKDYRGIVGVVNVPFFLFEPTHNKQNFKDSTEKRSLISAMSLCMKQYLKDLNISLDREFWKNYGYVSNDVMLPETDEVYTKMIYPKIIKQCSSCLKWRTLPFSSYLYNHVMPNDRWDCKDSMGITNERFVFYLL